MSKTRSRAPLWVLTALPLALLQACQPQTTQTPQAQVQSSGAYQRTGHGVLVHPASGQAKTLRLQVMNDKVIRVTSLPHKDLNAVADSLMVVAQPDGEFSLTEQDDTLQLSTASVTARVSLQNGQVEFFDADGEPLLSSADSGQFSAVTADPVTPAPDSYALRQQWNKGSREGYFGLGQHQNGQVNYAGENLKLTTHNLDISIPLVISDKHYGVLWDNASVTHFGDPTPAGSLSRDLTVYDAQGNPGGLTAQYYDGDTLLLTRVEADPDYQFLAHNTVREIPFPEELGEVKQPRVVWQGSIEASTNGLHRFRMYSSGYARLKIDGKTLLNRWRMNWNPWYHDTEINLKAGVKTPIEIDWDSQGGYFRLLHSDPLPEQERYSLSFASETGKAIDYYFIAGDNTDEVIAGYRALTGKSVMLPKWVYGFWQSRERYKNQQELVDVVKEYRKREIPLDNIVLDWSYWPEDAWGSHQFDAEHFPDPEQMVDEVHKLGANIMISIWPKFYPTTDNYKELDAEGYMLNKNVEQEQNLDWIGPGYLNAFYDPYPEESKRIFWRQLEENLNVLGFDAWWLDASEPDIHSNLSYQKRKEIMSPMSIGSGAEYFNSYALANAEGVYQGERRTDPDKRAFILTRSGFAGIQRTGAAIWSGDTVPRWSNLKEQIAAGIGAGLAGMPNWTMDIGGFTPENKYRTGKNGFVGPFSDLDKPLQQPWQELNLRWFQFGAFVPLFRSHGQNPYREIYNLADEGSEVYDSLVYYTRLRYRLMPYIYSEAGNMYHKDGTLMRGLVMDFPEDRTAVSLNDQYMFGPALLVAPIYKPGVSSREVYLPQGSNWYDFYTGQVYEGGQHIDAPAPLSRMPLFVKAGAIVPSGPAIQTVYEKPEAPLTLTVYTGADGEYWLYDDDGRSYDYEQGQYSYIRLSYDNSTGTLSVGERQGSFEGMISERTLQLRCIEGQSADAGDFDTGIVTSVSYSGKAVSLSCP